MSAPGGLCAGGAVVTTAKGLALHLLVTDLCGEFLEIHLWAACHVGVDALHHFLVGAAQGALGFALENEPSYDVVVGEVAMGGKFDIKSARRHDRERAI